MFAKLWIIIERNRFDIPNELCAGISADKVGIRAAVIEKHIVAALQGSERKTQLRTVAER